MKNEENLDVPSPIDLRLMTDASDWEQAAMVRRPWRVQFFERFASQIGVLNLSEGGVFESGSVQIFSLNNRAT